MREKMSRFREPSFRLLTGTRKLQDSSSNKPLDDALDSLPGAEHNGACRVRFALSKNETTTITNLTGIKQELWWSQAELAASRSDGKLHASTDPDVQEYLESYNRAYKKVLTDKRITSDCLRDLVVGLKKGYRGLEDHAAGGKMTRNSTSIRSYVRSVVKQYHDCCRKDLASCGDRRVSLTRYDSSRSVLSRQSSAMSLVSQGSYNSGSSPSSVSSVDKSVRNYSKKLTTGSRNFAQAMGRAEHLAAGAEKSANTTPILDEGNEEVGESEEF